MRKGKWGCVDCLLLNQSIGLDAKITGKPFSVAWIDYEKAYDRVPHKWVMKVLKTIKCPGWISRSIEFPNKDLICEYPPAIYLPMSCCGCSRLGKCRFCACVKSKRSSRNCRPRRTGNCHNQTDKNPSQRTLDVVHNHRHQSKSAPCVEQNS